MFVYLFQFFTRTLFFWGRSFTHLLRIGISFFPPFLVRWVDPAVSVWLPQPQLGVGLVLASSYLKIYPRQYHPFLSLPTASPLFQWQLVGSLYREPCQHAEPSCPTLLPTPYQLPTNIPFPSLRFHFLLQEKRRERKNSRGRETKHTFFSKVCRSLKQYFSPPRTKFKTYGSKS